ncbi:MAG: DUF2069 domain-containing protein [Lysobacter sp.]|nr:DUF2069 domain-containing protein [Lysobacter sp.]MDQ3270146.1 DUF2069 domain-containing protein [Pseudomonadota bacterium]
MTHLARPSHRVLFAALLALGLLYAWWFRDDTYRLASMLVFALPPLVMALLVWRGGPRAGLVSGLLALLWFSHGVLVAWVRPDERSFALLEIALAVVVVLAASLPGLRARFAGKRRR